MAQPVLFELIRQCLQNCAGVVMLGLAVKGLNTLWGEARGWGWGGGTNCARTGQARLVLTTQLPSPAQSPSQPANMEPAAGVALRVMVRPLRRVHRNQRRN